LTVAAPAQITAGFYDWNSNGGAKGMASCMILNKVYYWTFYAKNELDAWVVVGSCEMVEDPPPAGINRYTATMTSGTCFKTIDATTGPSNCAGVMADGNTGGLQHQ
jgi:hypothetical protein